METLLANLSTSLLLNTHIVCIYLRSSWIYEDVNYPFEDDLYILKLLRTWRHTMSPQLKQFDNDSCDK